MTRPHLVLRTDDVEPYPSPDDPIYTSRHVLGPESGGLHPFLNEGTLRANAALGGGNHPDNDEIYVALTGRSWVDLGGHPTTGEGSTTYLLEPGMVALIPAGSFHRLHNGWDEDFVFLTIWPQPSAPGANGVYDARLASWGTAFRLRAGHELRTAGEASRVVEPAAGWDPRVG